MFNGSMGILNVGHRAAAAPASTTGLLPRVSPPKGSPEAPAEPSPNVPAEDRRKDVKHKILLQDIERSILPERVLTDQERVEYSEMLKGFDADIVLQEILREGAERDQAAREGPRASHPADSRAACDAALGFDLHDDERHNSYLRP